MQNLPTIFRLPHSPSHAFLFIVPIIQVSVKKKKEKKSIIILLCDLIHALSDSVIQNVDPVLTDDLVHSGCIHMKNNGLETIQR